MRRFTYDLLHDVTEDTEIIHSTETIRSMQLPAYATAAQRKELFLEIIARSKNYTFALDAKLLNLLGCRKDDFIQFIKSIDYNLITNQEEVKFKYNPKKIMVKKQKKNNNVFSILENLKI